jgi:hypothetical protein
MSENYEDPLPSIIFLGDRGFVVYDREDEIDVSKIDKMLARTPTERLRWNEYWKRRTWNALRPLNKSQSDSLAAPAQEVTPASAPADAPPAPRPAQSSR